MTIYTTYGGYVSEINLHKKYDYTTDNYLFEADMVAGEVGYRKYPFNMLFETQEDAEWHREFGCIERTERLVLPTWEEVYETANRNIFYFEKGIIGKINGTRYPNFDEREIEIKNIYLDNILFKKPLTKENYTLACRKCVELFLGEKK